MSSNDVNSLERVPRAGLRSADASAPPRSHSQGATPSRLPADTAARVPRAPNVSSVATDGIGSPLRARGPRTPAPSSVARDADDALHRTRLEQENAHLRHQLELAELHAANEKRYAELQLSTDATIRELMVSHAAKANSPSQPTADPVGVQHALQLALANMNSFVQNPVLVANVALGVVVDVKRVNDAAAALLRLLGTLRGAPDYEQYLRHVLQLPKPGAGEGGSGFAESASCAVLNTIFNIDERPTSPDNASVTSGSVSGNSCQRLISEHAAKVASVLVGDITPGGSVHEQSVLQGLLTVDSILYSHLMHLVAAPTGSAVSDAVSEQRTFFGAMAELLRCAGHGEDQERVRRYDRAFDTCNRYTLHAANGGVSALTPEQLADIVLFDLNRRTGSLHRIDLDDLAARLVVAGLPLATGGSKKDLMTALFRPSCSKMPMALWIRRGLSNGCAPLSSNSNTFHSPEPCRSPIRVH